MKKVFGTNGGSDNPLTTAREDSVEEEAGLAIPVVFDADQPDEFLLATSRCKRRSGTLDASRTSEKRSMIVLESQWYAMRLREFSARDYALLAIASFIMLNLGP